MTIIKTLSNFFKKITCRCGCLSICEIEVIKTNNDVSETETETLPSCIACNSPRGSPHNSPRGSPHNSPRGSPHNSPRNSPRVPPRNSPPLLHNKLKPIYEIPIPVYVSLV
jgi:hypothetical protein